MHFNEYEMDASNPLSVLINDVTVSCIVTVYYTVQTAPPALIRPPQSTALHRPP